MRSTQCVTHGVQGLGSLFLAGRTGRCSVHPKVFAHCGTPLPTLYQRGRHWAFQGWEASFSYFCLRPSVLNAFRPIPPSPIQACRIGFLSTHSPLRERPSDLTHSLPYSPRDSASPCPTYQRLLPTVSTLVIRAFPYHHHPFQLLPPAPPSLLDKRALPCCSPSPSHR